MAPPDPPELPVNVQPVTVSVPLSFRKPPPAPPPGAVPPAIVRPEIDAVTPSMASTRVPVAPSTVRFDAPGPSIVTLAIKSGSSDPSSIVPETANTMVLPGLALAWVIV